MRRRWRLSLAAVAIVTFAAAGLRLAAGPVDLDNLRFLIIDRLQRDIPGARASIGHMQLVWFHDTNALGLRLNDLVIIDARGRRIASARHLEAALAIDSLLVWHIAPARLRADDFFVSASVSEAGRYELGYEARGKPGAIGGLDRVFLDLVGPEKLGSPVSFTRSVALKNGVLTLHQVNSPMQWRADLDGFSFTKRDGRIRASLGLKINTDSKDGGHVSKLYAVSEAEVGLKSATLAARIENLTPSEVFPSVGLTQALSNFHAPVNGRGNLSYSAASGFESGFVDISAGKGRYDFGKIQPGFDSMKVIATYAPKTRTVRFDRLVLVSNLIETDVKGKVKLTSEDKQLHRPFSLDFDFSGPRVSGKLADDFNAQTLKDVHFTGAFIPEHRAIRIDLGKGFLDKSAVETRGLVYTDAKGQLGASLTASIKGDFSKEQVFVFWPENLSGQTRANLIERIRGGVFSNARFTLKAPPGHITPENLRNEDLRLDFDFREMGLSFDHRMKDAVNLRGRGTLLGDSFALELDSGRLLNIDLASGGLEVPSFHKASQLDRTHIWLKSFGEGADIIEAIDPVTGNELGRHGFNHQRLSGKAEVRLDINFPTFVHVSEKNIDIRFEAQIKEAGLKKAALGWDLVHGTLSVTGDLLANRLGITGVADLGPYRGNISYASAFVPRQMKIDFKGDFDAAPFGGSPTLRVPITGDFLIEGPDGRGVIRSDIYNGNVVWSGKASQAGIEAVYDEETRGEPAQVDLDGMILTRGLVDQGIPIFARLNPEIPTKLTLLRAGNIWSGVMSAEVLSGDIAYIQGSGSRLVYKATITPAKARAFGFGGLPLFRISRHLTLNIGLESDTKEALITLDKMGGTLGWSQVPGEVEPLRTYVMTLTPEDWAQIGLPLSYFRPKTNIGLSSAWRHDPLATRGTIELKYPGGVTPIDFVMPNEPLRPFGGEPPFAARVTGIVDDTLLDALGYSYNPVGLKGRLKTGFTLTETSQSFSSVLNIDAQDADLAFKGSQWHKPLSEPAQIALSFDEGEARQGTPFTGLNITRIYAAGPSITVEGRAALDPDGRLEFADFAQLNLKDMADLSVRVYQNDTNGTRLISLNGKHLDLRPFMAAKPDKVAGGGSKSPVADTLKTRLLVELEQVSVASSEVFGDVRFDATLDPRTGITGSGHFASQNGTMNDVTIEPVPEVKTVASRFRLTSDDLGNLLSTGLDVPQIHGGKGEIVGYYTEDQTDLLISGHNLRAKQIPAMAQLLSLASLQGLADTMTGEGIAFSEINLPLRIRKGLIYVDNGWAKGDALGFNIRGTAAQDGQLKLSGVLIPAYRINALFGDVHDKGEGLVGIKYAINGSQKAPLVEVNPLSVMMPGFMRRWFEHPAPAAIAPLDLPILRAGDKHHGLLGETDEPASKGSSTAGAP